MSPEDLDAREFAAVQALYELQKQLDTLLQIVVLKRNAIAGAKIQLRHLEENKREMHEAPILILERYLETEESIEEKKQIISQAEKDKRSANSNVSVTQRKLEDVKNELRFILKERNKLGRVLSFPGGDEITDDERS